MSMEQSSQVAFGPFHFDPLTSQLMRGEQVISLQPKPLAVLLYLAQRPGQIVTKQELLKAVWTGTVVTKAVVKECVRAIRGALEEDAVTPQYIETVGREGYRFVSVDLELGSTLKEYSAMPAPGSSPQPLAPIFVGRETEIRQLHRWLDKALRGEPQLVFVTGEPGIGKTTIIERFREQVHATGNVTIGHGQCIEQYGEGEAYLPVLEAISRLCREEDGYQLALLLRKYAPTWLAQLPGVIEESEQQALQLQVQGATQQRMLREAAEMIEVGTARRPLVLILEDLHWSDHATVEFLAYLAKRRQRARLLVVATYRPSDVVTRAHPLKGIKQELQAHGQCEELRLELLTAANVIAYIEGRFTETLGAQALGRLIHRRTEGNALFMVNVVEDLLGQGILTEEDGRWELKGEGAQLDVPDTLRQLIEQQIVRLSEEEQRVLEGASVAGMEFSVAAVAAALKQEMDTVESMCEGIADQGHFLAERGIEEWPDGTISGRYGFRHALYQNVLYEHIAEARLIRLHRLIGDRLETGYGEQAKEVATELAVHFEHGHDYHRAVQYCEQAGKNAIRRSAHVEAITLLSKGLALLKTLPDTPERAQQELMLQVALGAPLMATKGYAAPAVEQAYTRALELCRQMGETPQLFPVLFGLTAFHVVRGDLRTTRELSEQLLRIAQSVQNPDLLVTARHCVGQTLYFLGEMAAAREHLEQGLAVYDPEKHHSLALLYGTDPGQHCLVFMAYVLWYLGYPDQALKRIHEALVLAQKFAHPFNLAFILNGVVAIHTLRRETQATQEWAEQAITLSTEKGFALLLALGTIVRGWALTEQGRGEEGIAQIRQGLVAHQASGAVTGRVLCLGLLAESCGKTGRAEEGLNALAEALDLVQKTGERRGEAKLYQLKGELMLNQFGARSQQKSRQVKTDRGKSGVTNPQHPTSSTYTEAEVCFHKAIDIARQQQAKSLELRATTSLARLWQEQGKHREAHHMLAEIYSWFTEGFDTQDLQEAKVLLANLT